MRKAFIQLHIAIFLAGFTGIFGKLISLNEGLLVWYRLLISAATMWILYTFLKRIQKTNRADIIRMTGIGFIMAVHWVAFYGSIKYANISVGLVCFSAVGFFTALFEPVILKRKPVITEILLGLMVMVGIYIIFHFDPRYKTGIILGIICALLGALFPIFNRQLMQRMNAETLITWELTGGLITLSALLPLYLWQFPSETIIPSPEDWMWLLALSWFCSVWAFQLSANALKRISAFTVNLSYNLEPVYGILLAFVIYHENEYLGMSFYAGLFIIFLSVFLQSLRVYHAYRKRRINISGAAIKTQE